MPLVLRLLPFLLLLSACNDHVASSAPVTRPVILTEAELIGRTLMLSGVDGRREIHLSGTTKDDLSGPDHRVYCAGDISKAGLPGRNLRWQLDLAAELPVLHIDDNRAQLRLTIDSVAGDRLFVRQVRNRGYHATHLTVAQQPVQLADYDERTLFFELLNAGFLQTRLPEPATPLRPRQLSAAQVSSAALFAPEDLADLEMSFEQNGRYALFSNDHVIRQGVFAPSADGQWLVLDGGCAPQDYWKIRYYDGQTVRLETVIEVLTELSGSTVQSALRPLQLTVSRARPQVQ